jgi:Trypsin-co-occurring domain 2
VADLDAAVGLSSALEALREELDDAWQASQGKRVRFRASAITLTVQAVARADTKGGGKLRWWVIEAGADHSTGSEVTHTLELKLKPQLYDEAGNVTGPLDVSGDQSEPGR